MSKPRATDGKKPRANMTRRPRPPNSPTHHSSPAPKKTKMAKPASAAAPHRRAQQKTIAKPSTKLLSKHRRPAMTKNHFATKPPTKQSRKPPTLPKLNQQNNHRAHKLPTFRGGDEKLQKTLSALGLGSRRAGEALIDAGRVSLNGKIVKIGARAKAADVIRVDGQIIQRTQSPTRLLCYHKPIGKIVARGASDSVFADLPTLAVGRWVNIGRLDVNSEGLLLFSTDGDLVQRLAHPKHGVIRQYLARIDGALSPRECEEIRRGIMLANKLLRPLDFAPHPSSEGRNQWYRLSLSEGRNRAVRRLFAHFNRQVSRLIRLQMGDYSLPRDLPPGQWRELTPPATTAHQTTRPRHRITKKRP